MNAIKLIELQNFQSHVKTIIEPAGPGFLTVITGPSDSGKTAIIRALKWLLYNQPQGGGVYQDRGVHGSGGSRLCGRRNGGSRNGLLQQTAIKFFNQEQKKPQVFEGFGSSGAA